jgi:serine/threonine protein kinase
MTPVWVKLGDFGVSKRILAQATTTFHTQVSTPVYSAPEVLGLDSNSEISDYTDSVDIWSLGCVIYELLVWTKLFVSEAQVSRYYFGKWPFPEGRLKELAFPIADVGISLLKSMLTIQPEDRLTAMGALSHGWLAGFEAGNKDSGDLQDGMVQNQDRSTVSRKRKNTPAPHDIPKKRRRSESNPISWDDTRCVSGDTAIDAGSQGGGNHTGRKAIIDASVATLSDATSSESPAIRARHQKSKPMPYNFQAPHSEDLGVKGERGVGDFPPAHLQSSPQNSKLNLLLKPVANENRLLGLRN